MPTPPASTTTPASPAVTIVVDNGIALVGYEAPDGAPYHEGLYELAGVKWQAWSEAPAHIPVETRLNVDLAASATVVYRDGKKVNETVRFRLPTRAEFSLLAGYLNDGDLNTYRTLVAYTAATRKDHPPDHCARVSGFSAKTLTEEVQAWRAAVDLNMVPR